MKFKATDPNGTTLLFDGGDSPPSEQDLSSAFGQYYANTAGTAISQSLEATKAISDVLSNPAAAEASKQGRRDILAQQMADTRIDRASNEFLEKGLDIGTAVTRFVSEMEPFNLLKRTLKLPQQLTGGSQYDIVPAVSPEQARKVIDIADPLPDEPGSAREGLKQFAAETLSSFTSPDQAAALISGKVNPELAARLFQTKMASDIPAATSNLKQAIDSGDKSEVSKAAAGLALSIIAPAAIEKGIRSSEQVVAPIKPVAPATAEALKTQLEEKPNAVHEETTKVLSNVRSQSGGGEGQVPVTPSVPETSARSSETGQAKTEVKQSPPTADTGKAPQQAVSFGIPGIPSNPIGSVMGIPVYEGKESYSALVSRFGLPVSVPRETPGHSTLNPFGNTDVAFINDDTGQFVAFHRRSRITIKTAPTAVTAGASPTAPAESKASAEGVAAPPAEPAKTEATPTPPVEQQSNVTTGVTQGEMIGLGGALAGEIPETGEGADIYGIAQRIREARAKAGQTSITEPGEGMSAVEAVIHGQEVLEKDPDAAKKAVDLFNQSRAISTSGLSAVRAMGEKSFSNARNIEQKFGTDSPEYRSAKAEEEKWNRASKDMQTEWSNQGKAQQGHTDIDTGSFTGLQRARRETADKDFTPEQVPVAKQKAAESSKANSAAEEAENKVIEEIAPDRINDRVRSIADRIIAVMDKAGQDALARIRTRRAEGSAFSGAPIDPRDLDDYVIYGASKIAKGAVEFGKWSAEMAADLGDYIKPHLRDIWDLSNKKADDQVKLNTPGPLLEKVKKTVRSSSVSADERAAMAASRSGSRSEILAAREETDKRVEQAKRDVETARVQVKAAEDAQKAIDRSKGAEATKAAREESKKRTEEAKRKLEAAQVQQRAAEAAERAVQKSNTTEALKAAREARRNLADPTLKVFDAIKVYIDQGETDPGTIFNKAATDLGMTPEQVYRTLAKNKRVKYLMDDMWKKRQTARILRENAKRWVQTLDNPKMAQYLDLIPQSMFKAKVFGHAGVALGTHAPAVGWQLRYWPMFARNYYRMWQLALNSATYERMSNELQNRPNYVTAERAGLKNRFSEHDEINSPPVFPWMSGPRKIGFGTRGYSVLKFLRQDLFDNIWNKLPKTQRTPEVAWVIANRVNHITGTLSDVQPPKSLQGRMKGDIKLPSGASKVGFAPSLLTSRAKFIFKDPAQSALILTHWKTATEGEKIAVKMDISNRLWATGTMLALLGVNAGILYAANSDQKINFNDPTRSDWLKFKGFGMDFAFGNAMISMGRLLPRLGVQIKEGFEQKRTKTYADEQVMDALWQFSRSQLSPYLGTIVDLGLGSDFQRRPLPRKLFGAYEQKQPVPKRLKAEGIEPYTWSEYASQQLSPIPFQEGLKEVWAQGLGMSDEQIQAYMKAIAISIVMGTTGGRVSEDYDAKK